MDDENLPQQFPEGIPAVPEVSNYALHHAKARCELAIIAIREALENDDQDVRWGAIILALENIDHAQTALRR